MKTKLNYILSILIFVYLNSLNAQVRIADFRIHDRGNLWETMNDDGTIGPPDPSNRFETYPSMDWPGGPPNLIKDNQRSYSYGSGLWIGGKRSDNSIFFVEDGPFTYVDQGSYTDIVVDENFIGSQNYNPNDAEQKITAEWISSENIKVKRVSKVWSFRNLNNFIIMDYEITNENSETLTDVYVGFPSLIRPSYQDFVVHNGWGDDFNRTDEIANYDTTNGILYAYDSTPNFSLPNDVGNYWDNNGLNELRTTGYAGYAILYADQTKDNQPQPATVLYAQLLNNESKLTTVSVSKENLYKILNGEDKSLQADNSTTITPFMLFGVGPYDLTAGQTIKISVVEAVNGLPIEEAIKGLSAQPELSAGLDSLRHTINHARDLFNNNLVLSHVPPPSPDIEIIPVSARKSITVSWGPVDKTWVDPVSGASGITSFKIYRANRTFIGPYKLVRTIRTANDYNRFFDEDLNKWVYEDQDISLGAGYYYAVTSVNAEGDESWLTNRNYDPVYAASSAADNVLNVRVFPNPFKIISGFPTSGSEDSIVWTNLPARCTVKIYTSSGELVRTMEHDNPDVGEEIWDQLSDARQQTAPGIYFWTVSSDVGNAKGTLLILK